MPDDKRGRDKQSRDADNRQRMRDIAAELERWDETEPPIDSDELPAFESALESLTFPAPATEVVDVLGDQEVESPDGSYTVGELVPETELVFDSPAAVKTRIQRPTVAAAMKQVLEASEQFPDRISDSQRNAYEKTFRSLRAIDADDDDDGIQVISDWILEQIQENKKLPGSRSVRRQAAKFCRSNGYEIRNDEWLGI